MIKGNDPAMPIQFEEEYGDNGRKINRVFEGLTIRQHFAAMAMQSLLSDVEVQRWMQKDPRYNGKNFASVVAVNACEFADALISELNK